MATDKLMGAMPREFKIMEDLVTVDLVIKDHNLDQAAMVIKLGKILKKKSI